MVLSEQFAAATGRSVSTVARLATGSGTTVQRLRAGCAITTRRADRALQWLSDNWPADLSWPAEIPRPVPTPGSPAASPPPTEKERRLAAVELTKTGKVRRPGELLEAVGLEAERDRSMYDHVLKVYADGRPRGREYPEKGTAAEWILEGLVAVGDVRFAKRRELWDRAAEVAARHGFSGSAA